MKFWGLPVWLAMSVAACTATSGFEDIDNNTKQQGKREVTFIIQPERHSTGTRDEVFLPYFGNGEKIDVLKFTAYTVTMDANGKETYTLATDFQNAGNTTQIGNVSAGTGQYVYKFSPDTWPLELRFSLDPDKTYRFAFWAQNSGCSAYDTSDLTQVNVKYSYTDSQGIKQNFINNDEERDAFTAICEVTNGVASNNGNVVLHRPFAQINIGTAGYDYEGAAVVKPDQVIYRESRIKVKGVADFFNVVTQEATTSASIQNKEIEFAYSLMPAYCNPSYPSNFKEEVYTVQNNEEFLKVEYLTSHSKVDFEETPTDGFFSYKNWDYFKNYRDATDSEIQEAAKFKDKKYTYTYQGKEDTYNSAELLSVGVYPDTEIFKYLSMCYVLFPSTATNKSGTITMSFRTRGNEVTLDNTGKATLVNPVNKIESVEFTVTGVPVQRNWRTNLLGNSFYIFTVSHKIDLVPTYCGDYNHLGEIPEGNNWLKDVDDVQGAIDIRSGDSSFEKWESDYYPPKSNASVTGL